MKPKNIFDWIGFIALCLGSIAFFLIIIFIIQFTLISTDIKTWDLLAFSGSIIGGVITWIGVRKTIDHNKQIIDQQKNEKEIEDLPSKIRILDHIDFELNKLIVFHDQGFSPRIELFKNGQYNAAILGMSIFINECLLYMTKIVDEAVKVNKDTYIFVYDVEKKMKECLANNTDYISGDQIKFAKPLTASILTHQEEVFRLLSVAHLKTAIMRRRLLKILFNETLDDDDSLEIED